MSPAGFALVGGAYALGSVPFGYLLAKARGVDITTHGSGNIGATNVMRVLGPSLGATVLILDVLKGFMPPVIAKMMGLEIEWVLVAGVAAVLGHCFSPWLRFRGGKGIATILGATLGSNPAVAGFGLLAFASALAASRIVSLSSIVAVLVATLYAYVSQAGTSVVVVYSLLWVFVLVRHRQNLARLMQGAEPRLSFRRRVESDEEPPIDQNTEESRAEEGKGEEDTEVMR